MSIRPSTPPWLWRLAVGVAAVIALAVARWPSTLWSWEAPRFAFAAVVIATALCAVASAIVLVVGWRARLGEIAILGAALLGVSVLPLVHGLTIPGVLVGPNTSVVVAAFVAVPVALLVALPVAVPRTAMSSAIMRRWRAWTVGTTTLVLILSGALLAWPRAMPAPTAGSPVAIVVATASLAGAILLALRQLRLYRIGHRSASLVASAGMIYLGIAALAALHAEPFSFSWWLAHLVDAAGVFGATVGLIVAHRADRDVAATLAPVVNRDPLIALELGLTPVVHRFVAALSQKDMVTRDHVVRVAELAMRSGARAGLGPERLRLLGLGALLHDIGKLNVPDAVLAKPGALTSTEFVLMQEHTLWGAELMHSSLILAPAAPLVRWHHERADGQGYPDGLAGVDIPLEARLISVCDAWDAMTSDRPYRAGMPGHEALAVLREHAGTQWCEAAVDLVAAELAEGGPVRASTFEQVGLAAAADAAASDHDLVCVCLDALPGELRSGLAGATA